MATIKELQARFTASASGVRSTIQGVQKDMDGLKRKGQEVSKTVSGSLTRGFQAMNREGQKVQQVGTAVQDVSNKVRSVGGNLTKYITTPIAGVITAAGAMTAAFGWDRLVGLDAAQAQLKGLGYETEDVERITKQVTSAIEGGMTTMAESTFIAAGALAAGVEEGAELERYIKLVGDAAVGANRPVGEMAMIFNRVQGSGKLMTQELNMVEEGMPGFSKAMADHLGVAPDKMREMVTAGEVSSDDFLTVMDGFAGGMASAYSNSWSGM